MSDKKCLSAKEQLDHWIQGYLQAKAEGDARLMKIYASLIVKLGGKIPKL